MKRQSDPIDTQWFASFNYDPKSRRTKDEPLGRWLSCPPCLNALVLGINTPVGINYLYIGGYVTVALRVCSTAGQDCRHEYRLIPVRDCCRREMGTFGFYTPFPFKPVRIVER